MAEVPVNINGVIVDLYGRTIMGPVKIVGSMSRTDVGIGGGPIIPPDQPPVDPPTEPPSPQWQWVWNQALGWHPAYVPGPTDAQPH